MHLKDALSDTLFTQVFLRHSLSWSQSMKGSVHKSIPLYGRHEALPILLGILGATTLFYTPSYDVRCLIWFGLSVVDLIILLLKCRRGIGREAPEAIL